MDINEAMNIALEEARLAFNEGEVPVGAVILKDGELIARSHNNREKNNKISGHAEIIAIEEAEKKLGRWQLEGCKLIVTLEPCPMCMGAIAQARISTLVYGADDARYGAISTGLDPFAKKLYPSPLIYRGEKKEESEKLINSFFLMKRK